MAAVLTGEMVATTAKKAYSTTAHRAKSQTERRNPPSNRSS
jgi:hypothetical protein